MQHSQVVKVAKLDAKEQENEEQYVTAAHKSKAVLIPPKLSDSRYESNDFPFSAGLACGAMLSAHFDFSELP